VGKLDRHGQPLNKGFNWRKNQRKLLHTLHGILNGISADGKVEDIELVFLDLWIKESGLEKKGDVLDLAEILQDILARGSISEETRFDALQLIEDIEEFGNPEFEEEIQKIDRLIGVLLGITSDDEIQNEELQALSDWLADNSEVSDSWQFQQCTKAVRAVLEDGTFNSEERNYLLEIFKAVAGNEFSNTGLAISAATRLVQDSPEDISISGKEFVITGRLISFKSRGELAKELEIRGAMVKDRIAKSTDYLVMGGIASRDWKHVSSGNKIKEAVKLRDEGEGVKIISENAILKYIG
jgi:NAD-dependent DNA ligase